MSAMPPRLNQLLRLLVERSCPVPVGELAELLRVSRRTVFRELENADNWLRPHGLRLDTHPGEGLILRGGNVDSLREALDNVDSAEPTGKRERHIRLMLALLQNREQQKLFYYAQLFRVSVSTLSHDLEEMDPWLARFGLEALRRPGAGVYIRGTEAGCRRALVDLFHSAGETRVELDLPLQEIRQGLESIAVDLDKLCAWMTPPSRQALERYLQVTLWRIRDGRILEFGEGNREFLPLADEMALLLANTFCLDFSMAERKALALQLAACRSNTNIRGADSDHDPHLLRMAYRMIEHFDPELAPLLKLDEPLLKGLVSHLRSAVVRLEQQVRVEDPLEGQIARIYPDLMEKTRNAATILESPERTVPESEISFLATHFGAAMLRQAGQGPRGRLLRLGVVCINGIGTSYLLAAQLKRHFEHVVEIEVGGWGDFDEGKNFDVLISTTPVPEGIVPVLVVPALLDAATLDRIREELELRAGALRSATQYAGDPGSVPVRDLCRDMEDVARGARQMLEGFDMISVDADSGFIQLAKLAGYRFGDTRDAGQQIFRALRAREEISTQVVTELGLVLLHCRCGGISRPVVSLFVPEGGSFTSLDFSGLRSCLVLLMPLAASPAVLEMMGLVSGLLLEDEAFLRAVREGDKHYVLHGLEETAKAHVFSYATKKLRG